MSNIDPKLFDVRVVEANIRRGLITHEDYEKFLAEQPASDDEGETAETVWAAPWAGRADSEKSL